MKDTSRVLALSLYIPNCDKKGFFKRRQVWTFIPTNRPIGCITAALSPCRCRLIPFPSTFCLQCKPSRGRRRGICWCVDRFGMKIPGINYAGGDLQCKDHESSSSSNSNEWEWAGCPRWAFLLNLPIKLAHLMTASQENGTNAYIYIWSGVMDCVVFLCLISMGADMKSFLGCTCRS